MVAGAERAHLLALAVPRAVRNRVGLGARHAAALLDALQILGAAVALRDRPMRAAREHASISIASSRICPVLPSPRGSCDTDCRARLPCTAPNRCRLRPVSKRAHAAGDVEADTAGRHDAARIGIEGRDAADRKAVAPMGVGHRIGGVDDARQARDIADLLEDLVVHLGDQPLVAVKHGRHTHRALRGRARHSQSDTRCNREGPSASSVCSDVDDALRDPGAVVAHLRP